MQHEEHVNLIRKAIIQKGSIWADLGSGEGAFTLALRDLAGDNVEIYSLDTDGKRLSMQRKAFDKQFPHTNIHFIQQDFTKEIQLPLLDGIIMANSLHYVEDHLAFLTRIKQYIKPGGELILVEYSIDKGQPPWVPYPLSYPTFERIAKEAGFTKIELLERIPSAYWKEMYSAVAHL